MDADGIEALLKRAAVDPAVKEQVCQDRSAAAERIGIRLDPAEVEIINTVPLDQLQMMIERALPKQGSDWRTQAGRDSGTKSGQHRVAVRRASRGIRPDLNFLRSENEDQPDSPPDQADESSEE